MNPNLDDISTETPKSTEEFSFEEIQELSTENGKDKEPRRYSALKSIIGLISFLGYIVMIFGIIIFMYLASNQQVLMGLIGFVISIVIALPLLAFSNFVYVFIDIEYNTRKTLEIILKQ